jgi:phosphoribosylaminoimidazole-succinocarboxamide synthase
MKALGWRMPPKYGGVRIMEVTVEKGKMLYEGKAKAIYATSDDNMLWLVYKDNVTAYNGEMMDVMEGKGRLNNEISALIFEKLQDVGINSHFIKRLSETEQLVKKVDVIPLEVVVRNIAAGSMAKRLGMDEGTFLAEPVVEFYYKNDALNDPLVTQDHIHVLNLVSHEHEGEIREIAFTVNVALSQIFSEIGITLVDLKLEFGIDKSGMVILADEISPDTCRLWDVGTRKKLDKDLYRRNLGDMLPGYEEVLSRLRSVC